MIYYLFAFILFAAFSSLAALKIYFQLSPLVKQKQKKRPPNFYEISVLLGSGGHTGQITHMLQKFKFQKVDKVNIIITQGDKSSKAFFENIISISKDNQKFSYSYIYRTNKVKQSYLTSIFTTIKAFFQALSLIRNKLLNTTHFIANGPGSCVPYFVIFKLLTLIGTTNTYTIFIQSWCRVKSISLTGKIVRFLATKFIVHWEEQYKKYNWSNFYGKII